MFIRDLVKQRWADVGLYRRKDARLQSFLKHVDDTPFECWEEYAALFRRDYYDLFDQVVPPLMATDDKLLRTMLLRYVDPAKPKELAMVREFVANADPVADRPELDVLIARKDKTVMKDLSARPGLIPAVRVVRPRVATNMPAPKAASPPRKPAVRTRKAK